MYSTCLFCAQRLGGNEVLEHFPVGRRLAFDPAKGRLWVVCRSCERGNLSPLETRWEAIEEADRAYRSARLRVSTDNIGLAQLSEGLELVRVGTPPQAELVAWRYGDQFGRRHRRYVALASLAGVGMFGPLIMEFLTLQGLSVGLSLTGSTVGTAFSVMFIRKQRSDAKRVAMVVRDHNGDPLMLTRLNVRGTASSPATATSGTSSCPTGIAGPRAPTPFCAARWPRGRSPPCSPISTATAGAVAACAMP